MVKACASRRARAVAGRRFNSPWGGIWRPACNLAVKSCASRFARGGRAEVEFPLGRDCVLLRTGAFWRALACYCAVLGLLLGMLLGPPKGY